MQKQLHIKIPLDIVDGSRSFDEAMSAEAIILEISENYLDWESPKDALPEVVGIQRLLTLAKRGVPIVFRWHKKVSQRVLSSPALFPMLAVAICLDGVEHETILEDGLAEKLNVSQARQILYKYKLQADLFSDNQILICADSRGHGRPPSLYENQSSGILARQDFESLVERLLASQTGVNVRNSSAVFWSQSIATIIAELFENTHIHGRNGIDGVPHKNNGIRGLIFKRVTLNYNEKNRMGDGDADKKQSTNRLASLNAMEISVFDAGIGFFSSYTKELINQDTLLNKEWKIVHQCLERHYDETLGNAQASHRGMGLYEVLRALGAVKGMLEVRTGRAYGYRTFMEGDYKLQMEPITSVNRPGMPKPVLLDVERKYVTVPTAHEILVGASVRVLIPLA